MSRIRTSRAFIVCFLLSIFIMIYFGILIFTISNKEYNDKQTNNPKNEQRIEKKELKNWDNNYISTLNYFRKSVHTGFYFL